MKNHLLNKKTSPITLNFNFDDIIDYQSQIEPSYYYIALNEDFPDVITFHGNLKTQELFDNVTQKYQSNPEFIWKYYSYVKADDKIVLDIFLIQIQQDLLFFCDSDDNEVKILHSNRISQETLNDLSQIVKQAYQEEMIQAESKIFLLYESRGLYLQDFHVKKYPMNLQENYNDDFEPIHDLIINRLNTADDKGIVLLYGAPGTGKTSYIRFLTSLINKKMIYISPEFAHKIASPDFLPLLIDNPNSVLIIEDAENIVEERESGRNVSVSNLLNLADGLLSDCLNIQILCTFNTHINNIDKALLRKGRLIASYEFKALEIEKAQKLSDKLGFKNKLHKPMTLSDIYNQDELDFDRQENIKIGFFK